MKIKPIEKPLKEYGYIAADYIFYCPGCNDHHGVWTTQKNKNSAIWSFNGDMNKPTFNPSLLLCWTDTESGNVEVVCHSFIRDGHIQFLGDCTHELKGQTVELPDLL